MSWQSVQWALESAPMLTTSAGKNDTTARLVLVALAERARGERPRAFPSITTLRVTTGLDREVIRRTLQRLSVAGLISDVGRRGEGVVEWELNTHLVRPDTDLKSIESEVEERREKDRDRKKKARSTKDVSPVLSVDKDQVSTVLSRDTEGASRFNTAESTVLSRESTVLSRDTPRMSTTQNSREPEVLKDEPEEPVSEPVTAEQASASAPAPDALFDAAPVKAKKTKPVGPKDAQAQDLAKRYYDAMSGMVQFVGVRQIVKQALGRFEYERVRAALQHMSTVDRGRPLTRQTLLAAIESPNGRANGHQPYRNPTDPNAYTGELA